MRAYIDSIGRALVASGHRDVPRASRRMLPRTNRSTFVPVSAPNVPRGSHRAA